MFAERLSVAPGEQKNTPPQVLINRKRPFPRRHKHQSQQVNPARKDPFTPLFLYTKQSPYLACERGLNATVDIRISSGVIHRVCDVIT